MKKYLLWICVFGAIFSLLITVAKYDNLSVVSSSTTEVATITEVLACEKASINKGARPGWAKAIINRDTLNLYTTRELCHNFRVGQRLKVFWDREDGTEAIIIPVSEAENIRNEFFLSVSITAAFVISLWILFKSK